MKKLSVLFSMFAIAAMFLSSCKKDDGSNTPITPTEQAVETFVGVTIPTSNLEFLEVVATHDDGNGKVTPCQFAVFNDKLQDQQWVKDFNDIYKERVGSTASFISGKATGTTSKTFTNKMNVKLKMKEGYKLTEETEACIGIYTGKIGDSNSFTVTRAAYPVSPDKDNSKVLDFLNGILEESANYTAKAQ